MLEGVSRGASKRALVILSQQAHTHEAWVLAASAVSPAPPPSVLFARRSSRRLGGSAFAVSAPCLRAHVQPAPAEPDAPLTPAAEAAPADGTADAAPSQRQTNM